MVMDTVGSYGDKYYHHFDQRWGMDILKVGTSLGAGALALQIKLKDGTDTLFRLGGTAVGQVKYELVKEDPSEVIFRLHYNNWKVMDRMYDLVEEISISAGKYYYESKIRMSGIKGDEKLVTGIVNLKSKQFFQIKNSGISVLYTHDKQSENNDFLGMAVMMPKGYQPIFGAAPNTGNGITNTYTAAMTIKNNEPVVFRFYGCWEGTDKRFQNRDYFNSFLLQEALQWNNTKQKSTQNALAKKL
jgi:hypothetical protein